jgi:REP element-mobilizing transposase RayT
MKEKQHINKSHNRTLLLYHIVLPAKYRRHVFSDEVFETILKVCKKMEEIYELWFLEIGNDEDHIHFMVQWVATMSVTKIVTMIKSIVGREVLKEHRNEIRKQLWWWNLRTSWYYANTVWAFAGEQTIRNYIKNQWISKYKVRFKKELDMWMVSLFDIDD